ncbi:MAG: zinc-ribbon domain-containing protein, partial [Desulfobacterales bacterium]|nr:zinc-ribbon domain-containing protein [Desulfobacterales bacterium]
TAMIVICEECGKKYRIDASKMKGTAARFKCRVCTHVIVVSKPQSASAVTAVADFSATITEVETAEKQVSATAPKIELGPFATGRTQVRPVRKAGAFNLRTKMLLLFLFIPLFLMTGASFLYLWQLEKMSALLTKESTKIVNQMAEDKIADLSTAVAIQCRLYLLAHPELKKEDFMNDMGFKTLAVQKVGLTGYTALYEMPDPNSVWRTWAHVNPKIISIDMSTLKKPLGRNFPGFWKIYTGVKGGKRSQGYYTWQDKDGKFRDKFMVCTPVAGTPFVVAATTYLDEFTGPVKLMETRAQILTEKTRLITWAILGGTLLLIGIIVFIYGHRLTGKIKSLTDVAERISIGDLGIEVETQSRDEIGELAEAISRMQDSIRLSIERLRRRR